VTRANSEMKPGAAYLRLALISAAVTFVLLAVGWLPTRAMAGHAGLVAMVAGLAIALVATLGGLVPTALLAGSTPGNRLKATLTGILIRFVLMLGLLLATLLTGIFSKWALAVWAVIGYIMLLIVDTAGAVWLNQRNVRTPS